MRPQSLAHDLMMEADTTLCVAPTKTIWSRIVYYNLIIISVRHSDIPDNSMP